MIEKIIKTETQKNKAATKYNKNNNHLILENTKKKVKKKDTKGKNKHNL